MKNLTGSGGSGFGPEGGEKRINPFVLQLLNLAVTRYHRVRPSARTVRACPNPDAQAVLQLDCSARVCRPLVCDLSSRPLGCASTALESRGSQVYPSYPPKTIFPSLDTSMA